MRQGIKHNALNFKIMTLLSEQISTIDDCPSDQTKFTCPQLSTQSNTILNQVIQRVGGRNRLSQYHRRIRLNANSRRNPILPSSLSSLTNCIKLGSINLHPPHLGRKSPQPLAIIISCHILYSSSHIQPNNASVYIQLYLTLRRWVDYSFFLY